MLSNRFLKYINIAIALVLVLVAVLGYWFFYRPLPDSGSVAATVGDRVTITRDHLGSAHIVGSNLADVMFAQGYATAEDRFWQMESLRRFAAGELSEVIGPATLEIDKDARRYHLREAAARATASMPDEDRAIFAAYTRGVNAYIDSHRDRLPIEFALLRYQPRPWRIEDSLLIGLQMYRTLTNNWEEDLLRRDLQTNGDPARVDQLFPTRTFLDVHPGSNAWAISGKLTASGKPILANDPHLEFSFPGLWWTCSLKSTGSGKDALNVAGVALPGIPGVSVGHNERIAWGITNLQFDVQDLYKEKLDPKTGVYLYRDQPQSARMTQEFIVVKGQKPVLVRTWKTKHGPVIVSNGKEQLSLHWTAFEETPFQYPFLDINRAGNWTEFRKALKRHPGPGFNFLYADVDGNIGHQVAGLLPIRNGFRGDVPVDGSKGETEWQGYIPFDELPSFFNPPNGILVSANDNLFREDYPYGVEGNFAAPYRARQIRARLASKQKMTPADSLEVQKDVYSSFDHRLAKSIVEAAKRKGLNNPLANDAVELLKSWNGQVEYSLPQPLITYLTYQHLRRAMADKVANGAGAKYRSQMGGAAIDFLLTHRPKEWFDDYDQLLVEQFQSALDEGQRLQGRNPKNWTWGEFNELRVAHPILGAISMIQKRATVGPVPMSGNPFTVKQTTRRLGPSMRFVADLSDWNKSILNLTIGQSGHFASSHFRDQWKHYYAGESYPIPFGNVDGSKLILEPKN